MYSVRACVMLFEEKQYTQDLIEALQYHASQKDPVANRLLAICYGDGLGVPKDLTKRAMYMMEAANLGDVSAMKTAAFSLRRGSGGFPKLEGIADELDEKAFKKALAQVYSDKHYAYCVGRSYLFGEGGAEKDFAKAYKYLKFAGNIGSSDALVLLANMYQNGLHVAPDKEEARKLLQKAIDMGNDAAAIDIKYL